MELSKLKEIMSRKRINNKDLARGTGVSESNIGLLINGKSTPRINTMGKIADFLNCEIGDLFKTSKEYKSIYLIRQGIYYNFKNDKDLKEFADTL